MVTTEIVEEDMTLQDPLSREKRPGCKRFKETAEVTASERPVNRYGWPVTALTKREQECSNQGGTAKYIRP